jgi:hypothetical protein
VSRYAITAQVLRMIASSPHADFVDGRLANPAARLTAELLGEPGSAPSSSAPATTEPGVTPLSFTVDGIRRSWEQAGPAAGRHAAGMARDSRPCRSCRGPPTMAPARR